MASVLILMGSTSDWPVMQAAARMLDSLGVSWEARVVSAHRTPDLLPTTMQEAEQNDVRVVIAGAGGAAHLPGMLAAFTHLPVFGVPVPSKQLKGLDSLLSIVQMPKGVAVGTLAIGEAGAANAGLLAAQVIATTEPAVRDKVIAFRATQRDTVLTNSKLDLDSL
ncbi:5-(carboxyamino)imidazole ribonucleotide mutase [Aliidiomarina sanyensis]|uniref:N5-carboxyaminoimidazole ribonucleotide mutase n=1 Tax=Aliidiomarina sanyensis TaxID=1249555 RepID=A0A432WPJ7_9GAMM|nr:5-(carboxyamino)imidazole ribonucleotide mutase [Aliidiomarina sanyensis]RUO35726.1 5-(carboxyamino)imidazole ribonucleotide mutase [Aliidiomarina sanyensis]